MTAPFQNKKFIRQKLYKCSLKNGAVFLDASILLGMTDLCHPEHSRTERAASAETLLKTLDSVLKNITHKQLSRKRFAPHLLPLLGEDKNVRAKIFLYQQYDI